MKMLSTLFLLCCGTATITEEGTETVGGHRGEQTPAGPDTGGDGGEGEEDGISAATLEAVACVLQVEWTQATAADVTWFGGQVFDLVLCEGNDDWFKVCLGPSGSYTATLEDYDNPSYTPPSIDIDVFAGSTPAGYSSSTHAFGLERSSPPNTCQWYTLDLVITDPIPCP